MRRHTSIEAMNGSEIRSHGRVAPDRAIADFTRAIELDPKAVTRIVCELLHSNGNTNTRRRCATWLSMLGSKNRNPMAQEFTLAGSRRSKDVSLRDGKRALEIATLSCQLSEWKDADCLDTLAAACRETGDFPAAIKWVTKAIDLITYDLSPANHVKEFKMRDRLKLYRKQQPYHE